MKQSLVSALKRYLSTTYIKRIKLKQQFAIKCSYDVKYSFCYTICVKHVEIVILVLYI